MKLSLEPASSQNLIRSYRADEIRVGAHQLHASCIVTADVIISDWPPSTVAEMTLLHAEAILDLHPELVLLGTGPRQEFPGTALRSLFTSRGVALEAMDLGAACRTYNVLVQDERRVAAALLLPKAGVRE